MHDDLYAKFLPQFVPVARARVAAAMAAVRQSGQGSLMTAVRELHTLAGEAGLLGLGRLVPLARDCEHKARAFEVSRSEGDRDALDEALRGLERAVEEVAAVGVVALDASDEPPA